VVDDANVRNATKDLLKNLGYQVLEPSNGLEAVEQCPANLNMIALIIMDVVMPELGSLQASKQIKWYDPNKVDT